MITVTFTGWLIIPVAALLLALYHAPEIARIFTEHRRRMTALRTAHARDMAAIAAAEHEADVPPELVEAWREVQALTDDTPDRG